MTPSTRAGTPGRVRSAAVTSRRSRSTSREARISSEGPAGTIAIRSSETCCVWSRRKDPHAGADNPRNGRSGADDQLPVLPRAEPDRSARAAKCGDCGGELRLALDGDRLRRGIACAGKRKERCRRRTCDEPSTADLDLLGANVKVRLFFAQHACIPVHAGACSPHAWCGVESEPVRAEPKHRRPTYEPTRAGDARALDPRQEGRVTC